MKLSSLTLMLVAVSLPIFAQAKTNPPLPERSPKRAASHKPLLPTEVPSNPWSDAEVAAAKAKCTETLSRVRLDFEPLPPIRQGLCGTPAPILLKSVGVDNAVEIDPPATVSCDLAKALSDWVVGVQREAKAVLGSVVVKLRASSYVCRNIYNRANPPLSQHALANALDLTEFILASGEHITVTNSWPKRIITADLSLTKVSASPPADEATLQRKSEFVRNVHEHACKSFGSVLGPRANKAHNDHFHLDMKQRRTSLCR
jgi:hypothetical protein